MGKHLPAAEYKTIVSTALIKLFGSADRGTRMALLDNLPEYADKLDNKAVTDKVWPNLVRMKLGQPLCYGIFIDSSVLAANWIWRYCCGDQRSHRPIHHPDRTESELSARYQHRMQLIVTPLSSCPTGC